MALAAFNRVGGVPPVEPDDDWRDPTVDALTDNERTKRTVRPRLRTSKERRIASS
jgi:hypothetical protein